VKLSKRTPNFLYWSKFVFDPVGFVVNVIGANPQGWQRAFLEDIAKPGTIIRNAVKSCHGPGKTALLAWLILWWICTRPYPRIPCTAPTEHQLNDKLWPELHKWMRRSRGELWRWFEWEKTRFFLREKPQEWFAVARVARVMKVGSLGAEAWGMQGFHSDHLLFLVDEASGVHDAVYGAIEGALSTDTEVKVVAAGNPNIPAGWFHKAFTKHQGLWNLRTVSYNDSPKVSNKWANEMIESYGMRHPWVQVKVLGEFPDLLENGLFSYVMIDAAMERTVSRLGKRSIGIDVARFGDNNTVFTFVEDGQVVNYKQYSGLPTDETALEAEYAVREFDADFCVVDSEGVGAGVTDVLVKLVRDHKCKVIEWHGSFSANDDEKFINARSESFWLYRDALVNGDVGLMQSDKLARQASAVRYGFDTRGRIKLERKEKIKEMIGESPDELDSSCLGLVPFLYKDMRLPMKKGMTAEDVVF